MKKPRCQTSPYEPRLLALVAALFNGGAIPDGSVVDCGANTGGESCFYADLAPQRLIHAVEPLQAHLDSLNRTYLETRSNIRPLRGALGSAERTVNVRLGRGSSMIKGVEKAPSVAETAGASGTADASFRVYRIDALFGEGGAWAGERLGFGHFDVEGAEEDLLRGGATVIRRDRPVFVVESGGHTIHRLLDAAANLGYVLYMVPERCGTTPDCRNLVAVPREANEHIRSLVPALARATYEVNASNAFLPMAAQRALVGR